MKRLDVVKGSELVAEQKRKPAIERRGCAPRGVLEAGFGGPAPQQKRPRLPSALYLELPNRASSGAYIQPCA